MIWTTEEVTRGSQKILVIKKHDVAVGSVNYEHEEEVAMFIGLMKALNTIKYIDGEKHESY